MKWDSNNTNRVRTVDHVIISPATTMVEVSVLGVTTPKGVPTHRWVTWDRQGRKSIITRYQKMPVNCSPPLLSSGSHVFTWMYQQLSSTEWSGPQAASNSSTNLVTAGKQETFDQMIQRVQGVVIQSDLAARTSQVGMSTSASTSTNGREYSPEDRMGGYPRLG
jgi:hypothetical protein